MAFSKLWAFTDYQPVPLAVLAEDFRKRIHVQEKQGIRVETVVLNAEESRKAFQTSLAVRGIQPVWIRITNSTTSPIWFLPLYLDQEYFAPSEASYLNHWLFFRKKNHKMDQYFRDVHLREFVPAKSEVSGVVYTHRDRGTKIVNIELLNLQNELISFLFFIQVGDMRQDYGSLAGTPIYPKEEVTRLNSYDELRSVLERFPRFVTNRKGHREGDPLNIAFVGSPDEMIGAMIHQGWDETEIIYYGSIAKTMSSFLRKAPYRYSPVSSLYSFGRPQDFALQKARATIVQRNHLRVWLTPYEFHGKALWLGQISRDIGVRLTTKALNLTTHVIDPDVDESRNYLIQDLMASRRLTRIGFVNGMERITSEHPKKNLTGDPFFTDGLRVVFFLGDKNQTSTNLEILPWERLRDHIIEKA